MRELAPVADFSGANGPPEIVRYDRYKAWHDPVFVSIVPVVQEEGNKGYKRHDHADLLTLTELGAVTPSTTSQVIVDALHAQRPLHESERFARTPSTPL